MCRSIQGRNVENFHKFSKIKNVDRFRDPDSTFFVDEFFFIVGLARFNNQHDILLNFTSDENVKSNAKNVKRGSLGWSLRVSGKVQNSLNRLRSLSRL